MNRLVVIGDSIAFGQFVSPHKTWVHLLSEIAPIPIDNFSWPGDTTRIALERSLPMVHRDGCSLAYVQFGCNDANVWESDDGNPRVTLGAYRANIAEIVKRCKSAGAEMVVIGTNHKTSIDTSLYDAAASSIACTTVGCKLISHKSDKTLDGVHLSEEGHRSYFERIGGCLGWPSLC